MSEHTEGLRTWRLHGGQVTAGIEPGDKSRPPVKVIEADPALDLLERMLDWATPYRDSARAEPEVAVDREAVEAILKANGRLNA